MKRIAWIVVVIAAGAWLGLSPTPCQADAWDLVKRVDLDPGFSYHPSPDDWRDVNMYQLFTDRFFDGNAGNNQVRYSTEGNPWYNHQNRNDEDARHLFQGGDWAGITAKLPYLADMGVKAIWISGVQINEQGLDKRFTPYHGYHPSDFYRCEPQFGTFDELRTLIDTAHNMGIYVVIDVVINHMADLLQLCNCACNPEFYCPTGCGQAQCWRDPNIKFGAPFDSPDHFHNNGPINNYDNWPEYEYGGFIGTEDLNTDDPYVQGQLATIFKHLIDATDCDGFRVDAIKHVGFNWVKQWANDMRQHAAFRGKNNFILFGELFAYDDAAQASYCQDDGYSFNSTLWFPMQLTLKNVFAYEQDTTQLGNRLNAMAQYGEGANNLVAFMDNHDVDRIALECGSNWEQKLRPALTFMYTALPVPCLFYGTEHGFNQDNRRNGPPTLAQADFQRETMFDYGWQWGNAYGDKFHTSPLYNHVKQLNQFRELYPCLRRGSLTQRWQEGGKGLFAYTRTYEDQEALVAVNTDYGTKSCTPQVSKPDGTTYINLFNPTETATVSGGTLSFSVDGKGSKIFVAGASQPSGDVATSCSLNNLRITYDGDQGPLDQPVGSIVVRIADDGSAVTTDLVMTEINGQWEIDYSTSNAVEDVTLSFVDQDTPPTLDDNDGDNWVIPVDTCDTALALAWVGYATHTPADGSWNSGDDLVIQVESWPRGAAISGFVAYSPDNGTTWEQVPLTYAGPAGNNDLWLANAGSYGYAQTVRYAVMLEDADGTEFWDNNEGADYTATVNPGTLAISWTGNTAHWPTNGAIQSSDTLTVNIQSTPDGAGIGGEVAYSSDGGVTWQGAPLQFVSTGSGTDQWTADLGTFPPATVITYAVKVTDTTGTDHWDNNGGSDYSAVVEDTQSLLEWYGNTHHRGFRTPTVSLGGLGPTLVIDLLDLKVDATYQVECSTNLLDWTGLSTFVSTNATDQYLATEALNPTDQTRFYRLTAQDFPTGSPVWVGDELVIEIETAPVGAASAVNLVYSADGGSTWDVSAMTDVGINGTNVQWRSSLGAFPGGTLVQYAIEVIDDVGASFWDNNENNDYSVDVLNP